MDRGGDGSAGYTFSLPTPSSGDHAGRVFLFRCDTEAQRMEIVETIRLVIFRLKALSLSSQQDEAPDDIAPLTAMEERIAFLRSAFRSRDGFSCDPLQKDEEDITGGSCPSVSATCVKRGILRFKHTQDRFWTNRLCVLTEDAFYVSAHSSPDPHNAETLVPAIGTEIDDPDGSFSVLAIPLSEVYIDKYQPNYEQDKNAPADAFAVWCPLAYALLGAESSSDKEDWIYSIENRRDALKSVPA
ncbi:unnamed protein product [Symbiodinium microadriaticum]|nr:unnamed protein product [Symbiodinium microadriaticum]